MQNNCKYGSLLGLAQNAGKVSSGAVGAEEAILKHKAKGVIVDSTISAESLERYRTMAKKAGIVIITAENPGRYIGHPERVVLTVNDEKFFNVIHQEIIKSDVGVNS